jgi:single-stranded-DNA-specific exonuclease
LAVRRRWLLAKANEEGEARLAAELGVSRLLARLLANRKLADAEQAAAFLGGKLSTHLRSPMLFRHMGAAAERVVRAVAGGERIGIYGDYDVDGVSGSAVLVRFLRALGCEPLLHIPHRLRDGYGLTEPGIRGLAEQGARVMITVDCGGVSHREIALAATLGMDTIVCDHHQVSGVPLPAHAVLNPIEPDAGFPFSGLCGAGVAFYLALGVRMRLRESRGDRVPDLRRCLDLVALGTVADLVPIVEENRVLVKYGLRELAQSDRPGVAALRAVSGVDSMNTGVVGFRLAPRLNAGGRLADARRSVELLVTEDRPQAERLAADLDAENRTRQTIERQIVDEAVAMIEKGGGIGDRRAIVLASPDWHPGVIGIVASRLVERYYRPTVLVASNCGGGIGRGSGRSIRGFNLYEAVATCREHLIGFGGHRMAIGLSMDPARVGAFQQSLENAVRERTSEEDFVPLRDVDCEIGFRALDERSLDDLERLEPYGQGNPEPVLLTSGVEVRGSRIVGETHLKLHLQHEGRLLAAIGFGMADQPVEAGARLDVLYSPMVRQWAGTTVLELRLRDFRASAR